MHTMVTDMHRNALTGREGASDSVGTTVIHQPQNTYHYLASSQVCDVEYEGGVRYLKHVSW